MVQYEYVGALSERTLLCVSVSESTIDDGWDVCAHLVMLPSDSGNAGRVELVRANYSSPLQAVEEALQLSKALDQTMKERRLHPRVFHTGSARH